MTLTPNRSDSKTKICAEEGCGKPLRAKGLCASHYNKAHHPDRHKGAKQMACFICDTPVERYSSRGERYAATCSEVCKKIVQFGTPLPEDHWARWWGKTCAWKPPTEIPAASERVRPSRFISNTCDECGEPFVELNYNNVSTVCSQTCSRRVHRRRRRAKEYSAPGSFRWVEVVRLWMAAGRRCGYCDMVIDGQPDPDHVVPLSRGGRNDLGNILPVCRLCNSDKCDMTLDEWKEDRQRRRKSPLRYDLDRTDPRFKHLSPSVDGATGFAYRHTLAA